MNEKYKIPFEFDIQLFAGTHKADVDISELPKLQEWVNHTDDRIGTLATEVEDIGDLVVVDKDYVNLGSSLDGVNINTRKWKENPEDIRSYGYKMGQWMQGVRRQNFIDSDFKDGDIKIVRPSEKEDKIITVSTKAQLGTPLTGDAAGTDAQYLVPQTIYDPVIARFLNTESQIIPAVDRFNMSGRLHRIPVASTAISLTHVTNEITSKTEGNPTWNYVDCVAETFAVWVSATDELLEDTLADIGTQLLLDVRQNLLDTVETQILNSATNPFIGILNVSGTEVETITGSTFSDADWEDLLNLKHELSTKRKQAGGVYVLHPEIWQVVVQANKDAMGRFYFDPSRAGPNICWGSPVLTSDNMPNLTSDAVSTKYIIFGNLKYVAYGVRVALEARFYPDTAYSATEDENFFRFRSRFGTKIKIPGAFACLRTGAA